MKMDLRRVSIDVVAELCRKYHGYGSAGRLAVYAFAVYEDNRPVAAYAWQPPPHGCAKAVCPEAPGGVLALSRMVAVPKNERRLKHVSKPLMRQMKREIDRTRWPVLVTFSDEGQGHTGYVYRCSGWTPTIRTRAPVRLLPDGTRASIYSNGKTNTRELTRAAPTVLQRWEHRICSRGEAFKHMQQHGWRLVETTSRWRSGNVARTWKKEEPTP